MAHNQRIFYACQAVAITSRGAGSVATTDIVYGAQSVGMSSTFTLDQVFELGQIEIYENVEEVADIEVTIEKVIDGEKLVFHMASGGACKTDLVAASKNRCDVLVAVFDDGLSHGTGVPRSVCYNSGMFTSSVSYSYTVDGSATESDTLVVVFAFEPIPFLSLTFLIPDFRLTPMSLLIEFTVPYTLPISPALFALF